MSTPSHGSRPHTITQRFWSARPRILSTLLSPILGSSTTSKVGYKKEQKWVTQPLQPSRNKQCCNIRGRQAASDRLEAKVELSKLGIISQPHTLVEGVLDTHQIPFAMSRDQTWATMQGAVQLTETPLACLPVRALLDEVSKP